MKNENKQITINKDEFCKVVAKVSFQFSKQVEDPMGMVVAAKIGADIVTELFDKVTPVAEPSTQETPTKEVITKETPKGKITLKEFFEMSEGEVCIHCSTKKEAEKLCEAFHKLGKKWLNGKSYLEELEWNSYKKETVYYNDDEFCSLAYAKENDHKIYKFKDVIFED